MPTVQVESEQWRVHSPQQTQLEKKPPPSPHPLDSKGRHEVSFHPSVPSLIRSSVRSSIRPVMVCLLRRGGERVEYRRGAAENNIY